MLYPAAEAIDRALKILHDYQITNYADRNSKTVASALSPVRRNNKSWSLPPKHDLKLNVDAHPLDAGHSSLGLVLRGDDGRCVGAATRVCTGADSVIMAEAMGLREALLWIEKLRINNVIIEMDAEIIVKAVKTKAISRTNWGQIAL